MTKRPVLQVLWFECNSCVQITRYTKENIDSKFKEHMAHDCEKVLKILGPEEV